MSRISVTGEVTRVFSKGFELTETFTSRDGREFSQRFTVWTTDGLVQQGDVVQVDGDLSLGVDEWTSRDNQIRHSVKASINRPTVSAADRAQEARTRTNEPSGYDGAGSGSWDSETPF